MALLARAPDGTIGLTSLGAEVRASSPSTPPPPRRRREISSRSRPNLQLTPFSPPEPAPQMAALDARASALDHLTQLIPLAACFDDGEEALFDHPPPRARRPPHATRRSTTAMDPDPTAPPSSTPGFDRLARRVAEMTAVADELSRVEAAERAWLGVRDAVARTSARTRHRNANAASQPEPVPQPQPEDVRALAANLARVATCGGVPPGDGSSSISDDSTSERGENVSALDAFRALETFADVSARIARRADEATRPRRESPSERSPSASAFHSRGDAQNASFDAQNASFDAENAWFAETFGRWGVAHAAMGAALRDVAPRLPPAPAEDDARETTKKTTRASPYASPWAKHATRAIDAVVSALERVPAVDEPHEPEPDLDRAGASSRRPRRFDETTAEVRGVGGGRVARGRRRVDPSAPFARMPPPPPSSPSLPRLDSKVRRRRRGTAPSPATLHWLAELIERTSRAAANWTAHQPRLWPSSRTVSDLCLAHSDAARVDDALARAVVAFANAAKDANDDDDAASSAASAAAARVSAARARVRLAVGRVADALVGFFAAAAESAYAAAPKGAWSSAGASSRGKRDATGTKSEYSDAAITSATSTVRDKVLLPTRRALSALDARVAASILPAAASAAVQALLARVSAEGRGGVRARGGGAARLRADVDALVAAANVEGEGDKGEGEGEGEGEDEGVARLAGSRARNQTGTGIPGTDRDAYADAGATALSAWRSVARRAAAVVVVAETAGDASRARERAAALAGLADANAWIETCVA